MRKSLLFYLTSLLFLALMVIQAFGLKRSEFLELSLVYALLMAIWGFFSERTQNINSVLILSLLIQIISIFYIPNLSDDLYRFVWDGRLILSGENPFVQLPCFYAVNHMELDGLSEELYSKLNSPQYYTVYPPISQFIYWLGAFLSPNSVQGHVVVMKSLSVLAYSGILLLSQRLLASLKLPKQRIIFIALFPLLIIEWIGNLHLEVWMVFFLLASVLLLHEKKWILSSLLFGLAISVKLIPLIFLPFLVRRLGWLRSILFGLISILVFVVLFLPFYHENLIANYSDSLDLYFRNFEFNASIYYLGRWVGTAILGYNPIHILGPALSILVFISIICLAIFEKSKSTASLLISFLLANTIYLFLSTTVHPWYLTTLIVLAIFTNVRYIYLWGGTIFLSYHAYSNPNFSESSLLLILEYLPVFLLLFIDWKKGNLKPWMRPERV